MSESASTSSEPREDELDALARSIREELRAIGFAPAFDPLPEELAPRVDARAKAKRRQRFARHVLRDYVAPAVLVALVALMLRLLPSG